jgi:predicted DNA-binding transcriptional regulator AlpA
MLDREDLAHHLRVSTTTVDRWVSEGFLPPPTISRGARIRLWARSVIEDWITSQAQK